MTCQGCVKHVQQSLEGLPQVEQAEVSLEGGFANLKLRAAAPLEVYQEAVGEKYKVQAHGGATADVIQTKSKLKQLRPLFMIFAGLILAVFILNFQDWNTQEAMLDFMGLFFLVFGFFKLIDLGGFPESFAMYDPLAQQTRIYGWLYPFIELAMGTLLMLRIGVVPVLFLAVVLLSITTAGIIRSMIDKRHIRCACLGTWLNLPMTEATLIENAVMIVMAIYMLTQYATL